MSADTRPVTRTHVAPGNRRAAITARYPDPPKYADDNAPQPQQPACYATEPRPAKRPLTADERALQWCRMRFPQAMRGRG